MRAESLSDPLCLGYTWYDANGNRTAITYPGNVIATSTYDYADRQETLTVDVPNQPSAAIVTASSYYPGGPLQTLGLGNGLTETHTYDSRYYPDRIALTGTSTLLDWQYTTEPVGNITLIEDLLAPSAYRVYDYQDYQYFLTQGDGPWGTRTWTYDPIGNRLSETRDGGPADVYQYEPNPTAGNSPKLDLIQLGPGGTRDYTFDAAGNQTQIATSAGTTEMRYDDASRLSAIENLTNNARTDFLYDGRSFLQDAEASDTSEIFTDGFESGGPACWSVVVGGTAGGSCPPRPATKPTYSNEGLLHHLDRGSEAPSRYVFYRAGMPVATLDLTGAGVGSLLFLTTDHLGTPVLASSDIGQVSWSGGFEPFGGDYAGAEGQGVFLRFPGQWEDAAWTRSSIEVKIHYNVHRWYQGRIAAFSRPDPLWSENMTLQNQPPTPSVFAYADQRSTMKVDPIGLVPIEPRVSPQCRQAFDNEGQFKDFVRDVKEAADRVRNAPPCKNNPGRPKKVKVKCGSCSGHCGSASPFGNVCINISAIKEGRCGRGECLGSTAFHEFIHQCGGGLRNEPVAWGCEKLFYGDVCDIRIPNKFKRCPNPCREN